MKLKITVPATAANLGPCFDCMGMAFKLYNTVTVEEIPSGLVIENISPPNPYLHFGPPHYTENNLIYKSITRFYAELGLAKKNTGLKITQSDAIPMTRGLGSSAACVVAGLLAANELSGVDLPLKQLCTLAAQIEGHPDNTTPVLTGGIVTAVMTAGKLEYIKLPPYLLSDLSFAVIVPDFTLSTKKARLALPAKISIEDAVFNVSRAAMMMAAFFTGDFDKLSTALDDRLHRPYRLELVPELEKVFQKVKKSGVKGCFLSGSGPSVVCIYTNPNFPEAMRKRLEQFQNKWELIEIELCDKGAVIEKI